MLPMSEIKARNYKRRVERGSCATAAFACSLMMPAVASAEPSASLSHLPLLWFMASVISGLLAWLLALLIRRTGRLDSKTRFWGLAAALFVVLLLFISPVIVGLGSILITGRTM